MCKKMNYIDSTYILVLRIYQLLRKSQKCQLLYKMESLKFFEWILINYFRQKCLKS